MTALILPRITISPTAWKALRYFNFYRIIIACLFVLLVLAHTLPRPLGTYDPLLFQAAAVAYLLFALLAHAAVAYRTYHHTVQVLGQVLLDVFVFALMLYASGGVESGLGILLVVSIAGGGILTGGRTALLFATAASLAVLVQEGYAWLRFMEPADYTQAGLLGIAFFATAFLAHLLSGRVRESEALAAQRAIDLANLARLNEHIVQRMQSGIIAVDSGRRIRIANESALHLLGRAGSVDGLMLAEVAPQLDRLAATWLENTDMGSTLIRPGERATEVQVSLAKLGDGSLSGTLIFLEDTAVMRQRAQQLKLASLGRLTASIAHEIRNPIGAISHASQLLSESSALSEVELRMTRIIRDHTTRINSIVEDILGIGRRDPAAPETFAIGPWVAAFVQELLTQKGLGPEDIIFTLAPADVRIRIDPGQLRQVLWNLCENALRYSKGKPLLELRCGVRPGIGRPYLDVIDHGTGIPQEIAEQVFEPFFTSEREGTGLGLYLASELCEANQASLTLYANSAEGCCFRIQFAHPDRQQLMV
ncbi:MAG: sensor histidine kinase [Gammaproteobacteria bacterium]